jgi:hypothetical protein
MAKPSYNTNMKPPYKLTKKVTWLFAAIALVVIVVGTYFLTPPLLLLSRLNHPDTPSSPLMAIPCGGKPASKVLLRYPYGSYPTQEFTTSGAPFFIKVSNLEHGTLDRPSTVSASFGLSSASPTYSEATSISNASKTIEAKADNYEMVTLDPGRYWLRAPVGDADIVSCSIDGVTR